jgi:hypothetical protein
MDSKYTFWKLIQDNIIEIPIIQRDYAQGRITAKETRIRKDFLAILHKKIEDKHDSINLDFVYGKISNQKLIPLDGQQRLTTLFLLHWYLAQKDKRLDQVNKEILSKFTYETRVSSREFCKALINNDLKLEEIIEQKILDNKTIKISEIIENQNWFYASWRKDSTVRSMLAMINALDETFRSSKGLFEKLICNNKPPITFDFLPLNEFNLTDELYVKMNARGKPLTDFEDFKAKLVELLSINDIQKLDNSWTDLFWKNKDTKEDKGKDGYYYIDEKFLNFFTRLTVNFGLVNTSIKIKKELEKINLIDIYEDVYRITNISNLVTILDKLFELSNSKNLDYENFGYFIGSEINYEYRAEFYAFSQYLLKSEQVDLESEKYKIWVRVTGNIINNFNIDSIDKFKNILNLINEMSESIDNLLEYVSSDKFIYEKPQSFKTLDSQKYEEHLKAKLIFDNNEAIHWNEAIKKAESHYYLNGHIGFLIELADSNLEVFKIYYDKFNSIFKEDKKDYLFQRALLTKGDYLVQQGRNHSFCSFEESPRAKDDNWKEVFHNYGDILKDLLTDDRDLITIINESDINDWRKGFIKFPKILKYCKKLQIRFESENDILLLTKERTSGIHAEYFSYCLYLKIKKIFKNMEIQYKAQKSIELSKYLSLDNDKIKISYNNYDNSWQYEKETNGEHEYYKDENELIESLNDTI